MHCRSGERERVREGQTEEDAPRDESEVCKDFGQSFLWNVTESRAFWEGDDDAGVFPTAPWENRSKHIDHTQGKTFGKMSDFGHLKIR